MPENKYPCGLKNFAMALVQTQSNGIQSTPVYQKWSCTRAFYSKNHLWKKSCPGVHITCLIRKSCIWILNKAGPHKSLQLDSKPMNSKQLPRGLYYCIKLVIHFRVNKCEALRDIVHSGILFTSGRCAAAPLVAGGPRPDQPCEQKINRKPCL